MDVTHDRLVEILRSRYDHYSARAILAEALDKQKIAVKPAYTAAEVEKIAEHMEARRDRTEQVAAYLRVEAKPAPAPHAAAPPVAPAAAPAQPHAKAPEKSAGHTGTPAKNG